MFGSVDSIMGLADMSYDYGVGCGLGGGGCSPSNVCNQVPISNITYNSDKLKINANLTPNQVTCVGIGCVIGAVFGVYLYKKFKEQK